MVVPVRLLLLAALFTVLTLRFLEALWRLVSDGPPVLRFFAG